MTRDEPIVISDSDSDTLSESERPALQQSKRTLVKGISRDEGDNPTTEAVPLQTKVASDKKNSETGSSAAIPTSCGLLGLIPNRKQLELERRERARKRRREQNLPSDSSQEDAAQMDPKRSKTDVTQSLDSSAHATSTISKAAVQQEAKFAPNASSSKTTHPSNQSAKSAFSKATDPIEPTTRFWSGTIKHGFNRYADKSRAGVTIPQFLLPATPSSKNGLQLAVLATYDLRMDWLYAQLPPGLPVTLILPPPKQDYRSDPAVARPGLHPSEIFGGEFSRCPGWQICVPHKPKGGWLTQHMKFLILVHADFLRIAILSGNLNGIDWERIENTAYVQDFPLLGNCTGPSMGKANEDGKNDFRAQLDRVLRSLSLPASHAIYGAIDKHDFSKATRARIVASWPEASNLAEWDRIETQGLGRLGKVVRDFGITPSVQGPIEVECQGSSLANHDLKWIEHFHMLASGVNPRGLLPLKGKPNETHPEYLRALRSKPGSSLPVKIVFPHNQYVEDRTVEGPMGALSFFGKAETFASSPIKKLYHSPQSRRGDVMIHAKSILAVSAEGAKVVHNAFQDASDSYMGGLSRGRSVHHSEEDWKPKEGEQPIGWTYLGSSNFTRAAHGNISGTAAKPTMSSLNWEL
nr:phospholipase d nuclease [Melanopsichium pennsylvanicum 4]